VTPDEIFALEERIEAMIGQLAEEILLIHDATELQKMTPGISIGFYAAGRQLETTKTMLQFLRRHLERARDR
jgi:hypothetical protein